MAYICITDGRIGRYDSLLSPSEIEGFYTDNFSSCNIIILYSKKDDKTRISMIHADCSITEDDVKKEIAWVSPDCEKVVLRRLGEHAEKRKHEALGTLVGLFSEKLVKTKEAAIAINVSGEIRRFDYQQLPAIFVHPQEWLMQSVYRLNLQFKMSEDRKRKIKLENTKLIFDVTNWGAVSRNDLELIPLANQFVDYFSTRLVKKSLKDFLNMDWSVREYIKANLDLQLLQYEPKDNDYIIGIFALIFSTKNDYQSIFKARIKEILKHAELSLAEQLLVGPIFSLEYPQAREALRSLEEALKNKIIGFLADINLLCHHGEAQKLEFLDQKTLGLQAPSQVAPKTAMFLPGTSPEKNERPEKTLVETQETLRESTERTFGGL